MIFDSSNVKTMPYKIPKLFFSVFSQYFHSLQSLGARQDATFQQLLEDYRQTVLQAQAEVESSLAAFFKSLVQLQELQLAKDAAERAAKVSVEQYKEGLVDFNTAVSTLRTLLSQQDQLALMQGTVAVNLVEVYRSLGGGWEVQQRDIVPKDIQNEMKERVGYWDD